MKRVLFSLFLTLATLFALGADRSSHWPKVRDEFYSTHRECEACGSKNEISVHHCKPFHLFPADELRLENLISLCERCHFMFGHLHDWKAANPHVREDAKWYRQRLKSRVYQVKDWPKDE